MRTLTCLCLLVVLAALSCGETTGGIFPTPVRITEITQLSVPAAPLHDGDTAPFSITWINGREPFQVTWIIDDGDGETFDVPGRTHTAGLDLHNGGIAPLDVTGTVVIVDLGGFEVRRDFTFTILPTPPPA